jgi:hypothetical protein
MRTAKINRKFLLALSVLALSLAALAPAARATIAPFSFEAGAFSKAHPPLTQRTPASCEDFQCFIFAFTDPEWFPNWIGPI